MLPAFLKQTLAGVIQELQVYKHSPWKLLGYFSTVIIASILQCIICYVQPQQTRESMTIIIYCQWAQTTFYFSPALVMIIDLANQRESNIHSFMMVNGMKRSAYIAKLLLSNYLFMLILAAEKTVEYHYFQPIISQRPLSHAFILYFASMVAAVNACLLYSRCIRAHHGFTLSFILFLILPVYYVLVIWNSKTTSATPFLLLNPTVMTAHFNLDDVEELYEMKVFVMALYAFIYLGLYILIEGIVGIRNREKKIREVQQTNDLEQNLLPPSQNPNILGINSNVAVGAINLKKIYPGSKESALNDISLKIIEGETICIAGYNGAGKTTLLHVLAKFINHTDGDRFCNFKDIRTGEDSMGFCPQDIMALPDNTVYETLVFWSRVKNVASSEFKSDIDSLLMELDFTNSMNAMISSLSLENKKKLSIAIALINDPKVIIMDEPTSGLDAKSREIVRGIIEKMKKNKKTIIFTTQFMDDAEHLAHRLVILSQGKKIEDNKPAKIKEEYGTGYTLTIFNNNGQNPEAIDQIFTGIFNKVPRISCPTSNMLKYALLLKDQDLFPKLFTELENIPNIQLNLQRTSLEEAFKRCENNQVSSNQPSGDFFRNTYKTTFVQQLQAVLLYRSSRLIQNKSQIIRAISLPLLLVGFLTLCVNLLQNPTPDVTAIFYMFELPFNLFLRFYVTSYSVQHIINDREKSKALQKAMGMKALPYWLVNLLVDLALLSPLILENVFFELATGKPEDATLERTLKNIYSQIVFSLIIIVFFYNLSRWYSNVSYMPIGLFIMFCLSFALIDRLGTAFDSFEGTIKWILYCIPQLCLAPMSSTKEFFNRNLIPICIQFCFIVYKDSHPFFSKSKASTSTEIQRKASNNSIESAITTKDYVKVIHCNKVYPHTGHHALKNLTFEVEESKIFCLLGPKGGGKTTLFKILANMIPLTNGSVQVNDPELFGISDPDYAPGVCLQSDMLWDELTVEQHLKIYALMKGIPKKDLNKNTQELMLDLGLESHKDKPVQHLSGGTKRKLAVANAVIGAPKLIILDEPTTGVDPIGRNQIWTLMKSLTDQKRSTVLISTHDMEDAELADKLGILVNGELKAIGDVSNLRIAEEEHFLRIEGVSNGFMQLLDKKIVEKIPGARLIQDSNENKRIFKIPSTEMKFAEICTYLVAMPDKISQFSIHFKTLEQAFLQCTQE